MIDIISSCMVVTQADQRGKRKRVQPGNREWATAIACINAEGYDIPPFLVVQGTVHLTNWYTEGGLPHDWVVKPTNNGWSDNDTGLDWIQHFNKHTELQTKGGYQMLVLDRHGSHMTIKFDEYYKNHNIMAIALSPHSSYLTQPLDVVCFGVLKRNYRSELDVFIKVHITYITKTEFFIAFQEVYCKTMTKKNIKARFSSTGLVPHDPQAVLSKLNIVLWTSTPTRPPPAEADP
jgi:DDE superfamily endonuclease